MSKLNIYVVCIVLSGFITTISVFDKNELMTPYLSIIFGLVAVLFALARVELLYGSVYSGTPIIVFSTYFLFGMSNAILMIAITVVTEGIYNRSTNVKKILFNYGEFVVGLLVLSNVYMLLGGTVGGIHTISDFLPMIISYFVYGVVNICIVDYVFSIVNKASYMELLQDDATNVGFFTGISTCLTLYLVYSYSINQNAFYFLHLSFIIAVFLILRIVFRHYINLRKSHLTLVASLAHMTDEKTHQDQHAARVGWIAQQIGEKLKLPSDQLDELYYAAMFHDIGKTSINERIFQRKGPLTLEEQKDYQTHVQLGYEWLLKIEGYHNIANVVLHHHEHWNGGGFPNGLQGEGIPYHSRIIAVANRFDHLLMRDKLTAFKQLKETAGIELDPELVQLTLELDHILERYEDPKEISEWMKLGSYVSEVRQRVYNSELLNHFGVNLILNYEHGVFYNHSGQHHDVPCADEVARLVEQSIQECRTIRHTVQDDPTGIIYDVYCLPMGNSANVLLFDVTQVIHYEKEQENKLKKIYKDVIYAVTQSKLLLADSEELQHYLRGTVEASHDIRIPADITECRHMIDRCISPFINESKKKYQILLCINESLTNVLKHAQKGSMKLYIDHGNFRVLIEDNGNGIDLADLPRSTLMQGYSSKISLGQGFKLMLHYADQLILCTGSSGTSILLQFNVDSSSHVSRPHNPSYQEGEINYA